jgi:hypothetical protein
MSASCQLSARPLGLLFVNISDTSDYNIFWWLPQRSQALDGSNRISELTSVANVTIDSKMAVELLLFWLTKMI